jgi:two-component system, NtrC family, response regulator AtoC
VEMAVEAMKAGADDYLVKPVSLEEIAVVLEKLFAQTKIEQSLSYFQTKEKRRSGIDLILGDSPVIETLKSRLGMILDAERAAPGAPERPTVLILGETGTGKELIARALHFDGPRRDLPFVEVNCAALPEQLVESELFGHERGAFTDARERKIGLFQAADGGTLFLDEIGELPLLTQAKLLRTLEERTIRPVGGLRDLRINARVIAATNTLFEDKIRQGEFRKDLYYRLNTLVIDSPPLRSRGNDILTLANVFLAEFRGRYGRTELALGDDATAALLAHSWPGNVRELRNIMEQACLLTVGRYIRSSDLSLREPAPIQLVETAVPIQGGTLNEIERDLISSALGQVNGNVTLAARQLGVSRDTLRYRMEKYGIRRDEFL